MKTTFESLWIMNGSMIIAIINSSLGGTTWLTPRAANNLRNWALNYWHCWDILGIDKTRRCSKTEIANECKFRPQKQWPDKLHSEKCDDLSLFARINFWPNIIFGGKHAGFLKQKLREREKKRRRCAMPFWSLNFTTRVRLFAFNIIAVSSSFGSIVVTGGALVC